MPGPIKDFCALKPMRKVLKAQHKARQLAAAEHLRNDKKKQQQAKQASAKFSQHVGPVFSIKSSSSDKIPVHTPHPQAPPHLKNQQSETKSHTNKKQRCEPNAILQALLSDEFSIENLHENENDSQVRFARNGVGTDILQKLYQGYWTTQQQLDLHGLRTDQARDTIAAFIQLALKRRWRCVRIVHGKGFGSLNQAPVLKGKVRDWLVQIDDVVAFCQAHDTDGGSGALVVLLKAQVRF
ncbi:MAG: Smr/MutS family protein [Glaciimonas sp.]|nr:Smr/MutS family protein [Glaciimonas sp.]